MEVLAIGWSRVTKLKENPVSAFEVARRGSTFFGIENFVLTKWRSLYLYVARCHTLFKCRAAHTLLFYATRLIAMSGRLHQVRQTPKPQPQVRPQLLNNCPKCVILGDGDSYRHVIYKSCHPRAAACSIYRAAALGNVPRQGNACSLWHHAPCDDFGQRPRLCERYLESLFFCALRHQPFIPGDTV